MSRRHAVTYVLVEAMLLAAMLGHVATPAIAATVSGKVMTQTGAALSGATVRSLYYWRPSGSTVGTWSVYSSAVSGPTGAYSVDTPPNAVIGFSRTGYAPEFFADRYATHTADRISGGSGINAYLYPGAQIPGRTIRLQARDRYDTSAVVARWAYTGWGGVRHIIIVSGEDRAAADPLAAAGLAWAYGPAPVLLVRAGSVNGEVEKAIQEIVAASPVPVKAHIVGGPVSVPEARKAEIAAALGANAGKLSWDRVTGVDRYDVAGRVAARMKAVRGSTMPGVALVANGAEPSRFFDALALSAISAHVGAPVLLATRDGVPGATRNALNALGKPQVYVAGGPASVSPGVVTALGSREASRMAGATRYATANKVADMALARGWLDAGLTGVAAALPDALTGGAAIGGRGHPLLLTPGDRLGRDAHAWLWIHRASIGGNVVFGGYRSVGADVIADANIACTR